MPGLCCNLIITKGLGCTTGDCNRLIGQGYGGPAPPTFVTTAIRRFAYGRRPDARIDEVIIWAKLLEVNGKVPSRKIEGYTRTGIETSPVKAIVEHISSRSRETWEDIKVTIKRLK